MLERHLTLFLFFYSCRRILVLILYCTFSEKQLSFFEFKSDKNPYGILEETIFLLFSSVLYMVLILLFEYKIFARLYQFRFNKTVEINDATTICNENIQDPDIDDERKKVDFTKKHFGRQNLLRNMIEKNK